MKYLYDLNLLAALSHREHGFNAAAKKWHRDLGDHHWATCEQTRTGFVRLSMNPTVVATPLSALQALEVLCKNTESPRHEFLTPALGNEKLLHEILRRVQGYRQVPDAYLIHLAATNGYIFATFDQKLKHLSPDPSAIEIISFD
jgi:toxin-antitoxin system PIN domain toxin